MRASFSWSVSVKRVSFLLLSQGVSTYPNIQSPGCNRFSSELHTVGPPHPRLPHPQMGKHWVGEWMGDPESSEKQNLYLLCCVSVGVLEPICAVSRCIQMWLYFHFFLWFVNELFPFVVSRFLLFVPPLSLLCLSVPPCSPLPLEAD